MNPQLPKRTAIFISHATPEDNEFTIWLGAHLSGAGYEVWADVLKLRGGQDWARKVEEALRYRAFKVLLVGTRVGMEKQGVRNEIQIASDVAKQLGDREYIIPLRREAYDPPFHIVQAQHIDFMKGWSEGLAELLETLETYKVPRSPSVNAESIANYRNIQLLKSRTISARPQELVSNWIRISEWPKTIQYYSFKGSLSEDRAKAILAGSTWPTYLFRNGFITFADESDFMVNEDSFWPIVLEKRWYFEHFLKAGDNDLPISNHEVQNIVSHLTRTALERKLQEKNLHRYDYSNGVSGWWVPAGLIADDKVIFKWDDTLSGRRQMTGEVAVRKERYKWHFGVSGKPWISRSPYIRFMPRIIFSLDGRTSIDDVRLMHRLRRSVPRSWRNERWRDLLLAFLFWFSRGERKILLETGSNCGITLALPPILMNCPISIQPEDGELPEEMDVEDDDPVFAAAFDGLEEGEDEA